MTPKFNRFNRYRVYAADDCKKRAADPTNASQMRSNALRGILLRFFQFWGVMLA